MKKLLISVGFRSELMLLLRVVRIYLRVLIKYAHNRLSLLEIHHRNKRRHDQGNWGLTTLSYLYHIRFVPEIGVIIA
jgi:hypothetical protein